MVMVGLTCWMTTTEGGAGEPEDKVNNTWRMMVPGCLLLLLAHSSRACFLDVCHQFLYDAVPTSKTGLPLGRLVLVTSPKRERYHVSISSSRLLIISVALRWKFYSLKILSLSSSIRVGGAQGGRLWQVPHGALDARGT